MNINDVMLAVRDLHAGYGAARVLHGVSVDVRQGSVTALIGANGAGKTTLMRALSGLILPTAGEVRFLGKDLTRSAAWQRVAEGIALSPEGRMVFPTLTVEENLRLGAISRPAWTRDNAQIEKTYAMFPRLKERRRLSAGALSGGEQQMLALARALMSQPRLLLLDEPTLGLAPAVAHQIFEVVGQLRAAGLTVLIAEQNAQRTLELADYAYVIEHGQVHSEGSGTHILNDPAIKQAYLGL